MTLGYPISSISRRCLDIADLFAFREWYTFWMRRYRQPHCQGADANSRDAFVPPKPKEFDKAALIGISFEAVKGMKASLNTGSGFERFSVSGAIPCNQTGKQYIKKKGHCH